MNKKDIALAIKLTDEYILSGNKYNWYDVYKCPAGLFKAHKKMPDNLSLWADDTLYDISHTFNLDRYPSSGSLTDMTNKEWTEDWAKDWTFSRKIVMKELKITEKMVADSK